MKNQDTKKPSTLRLVAGKVVKYGGLPPKEIFGISRAMERHNTIVEVTKGCLRIPEPIPDENRRSFQWWMQHFGVNENEVDARAAGLLLEARFCYAFALVAFALGLSYAFDGSLAGLVCGFCATTICGVAGFVRQFRWFQFKRRELCDFSVFLKSPEGWFA